MYVDCEVCGERYSGSESEVRQWITETMVLDKNGEEETISHCVSCEVPRSYSFVFALSSHSSDIYHLADGEGQTRCGAKIDLHHREQSLSAPAGWVRCRRPGCAKEKE